MSSRFGPVVIIPVVCAAAVLAIYGFEREPAGAAVASPWSSSSTTPPLVGADEVLPSENGPTLPPDHPPIGGAASPHGAMPGAPAPAASDPPALVWKMPPAWREAPNPNSMRLATYRAPGGVEISVSRAGGQTDANIQRWVSQFENAGHEERVDKTVHGLHVVTVDVSGTYVGGGMNMGGPAEPKPDWAMVGAIVESPGTPYFFKMTGPAAAVRAARPAFDHVVDGVSPT